MSQPIQVAAAVIVRGSRLLLSRRPRGKTLCKLWEFPGGKQLAGESLAKCLKREMRESTGIRVAVGEKFAVVEHEYPEGRVRSHFYRCSIDSGSETPLECSGLEWVHRDALFELQFLPSEKPVLKLLRTRQGFWEEPSSAA